MLEINKLKRELVPTPYRAKPTIDCVFVYKVSNFRWLETPDPIILNVEFFVDKGEAIKRMNSLEDVIGFTPVVEELSFELEDITLEDIESGHFNPEDYSPYCVDVVDSLLEYRGKDITGSIIIEWSYEKYVGYARNLLNIGIVGEWPYDYLKDESDLITGNEEYVNKPCFSVLLTKEEVEEKISEDNLEEQVDHELYYHNWRWNHFKNNPKTLSDRIEEIIKFAEDELRKTSRI
jgi:hypothetical protein